MIDSSDNMMEALITILDVDFEDELIKVYEDNDIPFVLLTYGLGSAKSHIFEMLGYGGARKLITISIHPSRISNFVVNELHKEVDLHRPGTGICFTISISSMSGVFSRICNDVNCTICQNKSLGSENIMGLTKEPYQLVITIVNTGHFDEVMEAAKTAGANGGTLIHARSLGSEEATKYLGITVQPEKDLILMLVPQEKRHAIMDGIMTAAGLNTPALGSCFSLPVNNVIGVRGIIDNFNEL
ncbi:MAG: P-II family nitrogen regulator [Anaerovoracaceae bacterium]|jgi:nitrogen regulatory protein PII